jgi:hypothetical protein
LCFGVATDKAFLSGKLSAIFLEFVLIIGLKVFSYFFFSSIALISSSLRLLASFYLTSILL